LNGSQLFDSLKIYNKNEIQKYAQKIRSLKLMIHFFLYSILSIHFLLSFTFLFYDYSDIISFGLLSAFIYLINCYFWSWVIGFSFLYYFIVCFYCRTIFESFINSIKLLLNEKVMRLLSLKLLTNWSKDHNSICLDTKIYNKFWQKYYFSLTYTLIPLNLMLLLMTLFC
jgi:hypothetical protein